MFVTPALAQAATQPEVVEVSAGMKTFTQLAIIFFIFYIFLIRPQQKRAKQHQRMLSTIQKGSKVMFAGVLGTVEQVIDEQELSVEIADGVRVKVLRSFITQVVNEETK